MTPEDNPPFGPPYQEDDTNGWVEVDVKGVLRTPNDQRPIPFQLFANRFKSSSEQSELFLHDPLRQIRENPGELERLTVPGFDLGNISADDPKWHVTTFIANHHRRLSWVHVYAIALFGPDGVHLMIYKDADPDSYSA